MIAGRIFKSHALRFTKITTVRPHSPPLSAEHYEYLNEWVRIFKSHSPPLSAEVTHTVLFHMPFRFRAVTISPTKRVGLQHEKTGVYNMQHAIT